MEEPDWPNGVLGRVDFKREGGLNAEGLAGALLLRVDRVPRRLVCLFCASFRGFRSSSPLMTRPISKSSSGSGVATLTCSSTCGVFFFMSRIFVKCFRPCSVSNRPVGITRPSRSPSSSLSQSSSVPGNDAEVELVDGDASIPKPRVE